MKNIISVLIIMVAMCSSTMAFAYDENDPAQKAAYQEVYDFYANSGKHKDVIVTDLIMDEPVQAISAWLDIQMPIVNANMFSGTNHDDLLENIPEDLKDEVKSGKISKISAAFIIRELYQWTEGMADEMEPHIDDLIGRDDITPADAAMIKFLGIRQYATVCKGWTQRYIHSIDNSINYLM